MLYGLWSAKRIRLGLAAQNAKNRKHIAWSITFAKLKREKLIMVSSAVGFPKTWVPVTSTPLICK